MQGSPKKKQKLEKGSKAKESGPHKRRQDNEDYEVMFEEEDEAQSLPDDSDTATEGVQ